MGIITFNLACRHCGGDLFGLHLDDRCPNCRRSVGTTLDVTLIDSESMTVSDDAACSKCGYNLRTLAVGSLCPECGSLVANSLVLPQSNGNRVGRAAAWIGYLTPLVAVLALMTIVSFYGPHSKHLYYPLQAGFILIPGTAFLVGTISSMRARAPWALLANMIGLAGVFFILSSTGWSLL